MGKEPKYYVVFGLLFALLTFITTFSCKGYFGPFGVIDETHANFFLLGLLCLSCGMQNGTVSLVSKSVVRTSHLTGITTDLGIGLVRVAFANRLKEPLDEEPEANAMRIGVVLNFILGSCLGYFAFQAMHFYAFIIPTAFYGILFFLMIYFQLIRTDKKNKT